MGDATGELAHRLHLLRLAQLLLGNQARLLVAQPLGDVQPRGKESGPAVELDGPQDHLDIEGRAVLPTMAETLDRRQFVEVEVRRDRLDLRQLLRRIEVTGVHRQQLLTRPAILPHRGVADGENAPALAVDRGHRIGVGLEQHAIALLRLERFRFGRLPRLLGPHAVGDVAGHHHRYRPAVELDQPHVQLDIDDIATLGAMP